MRISCLQYTAESSVATTESRLYPLLDQAVSERADWVLLPECALSLSASADQTRAHALSMDSDPVRRLFAWAKTEGRGLIVGSLVIEEAGRLMNRCLVIDRTGELIAQYDKIHLFDVELGGGEAYRESAVFAAGDRPVLASLAGVRVGLSICFDLRFPKLYRHYASEGASILLVPAAFTRTTGQAHWHTLLRARAIENGVFVVAAGQCGRTQAGRETYGHSVIYGPWGETVGELGEAPGVLTCELDLAEVARGQSKIPVHPKDRDF